MERPWWPSILCACVISLGAVRPCQAVALRHWLERLEVSVPPFPVVRAFERIGIAINVTGGSCQGLKVEELLLTEAFADTDHFKIALQTDVGSRCVVNTTVEVGSVHSCTLAVSLPASVIRVAILVPAVDGLPGQVTTTCEFTPDITHLEFHQGSTTCDALRIAQRGIKALVNELGADLVCKQVSTGLGTFFSQAVREVNGVVKPYLKPAAVLKPPHTHGAVDLRGIFWKGPVGHVLRSFLREVAHVDNNVEFNKVLRFLRSDLGIGAIALPTADLQVVLPWIQKMVFALKMQSVTLDASSLKDLHFSFTSSSAARLSGGLTPVVSMAAETAVLLPDGTASLNVSGRQLNITQHVPLSPLQLRAKTAWQVAGAATGFVAYNGSGLGQLQLDQMQTMGCASIFLDQQVALPVQLLEVRCAAQLQHLAVELPGHDREDLENHILKVCLTVLQLLGTTFGNTAVQALDGFISQRGRSIVNEILERMLSQPSACPASNYSSGEIGSIALPSSWGSGVCLSIMALLFIAYLWPVLSHCAMHNVGDSATSSSRSPVRCWSTRGQTTSPSSVPETEESSQSLQAGCHPDLSNDSFRLGKGLGWQPGVSPFLRWGILSGIAGTTLLFVYASVTPGILLSGSFKASNGSSDTRHMASLSMDNSLVQTWSVGSYFVFCAMLIFSVLWPYVKLLMMMYAWVTPMDHGIRGPMLIFLDQIGKWSLMDNIILFLFIVFFWISWTGEDTVEGGEASFGLKCSPEDELNTFLAATILSLLLGHAMLWIHRWQNSKLDGAGGEACIQSGHDARRLRVVGAGHITCFLLMVLSWQVEIVEVTFSGLVGTFLEVTHQPMSKRYSILGILSCLGKQGSKYLQVTFAIFVLAIPMLQLLAMTFICLYQLHPKRRQQLLRLCYTLRAWAAYDVFLLAFLAAVLGGDRYGIGQYIELIVYKQNLAPTCRIFRDMGIECLHIRLGFLPGTIIIVAAVALSYVVSLLVARETRPG